MKDIRVAKFEKNRAVITATVSAQTLKSGIQKVYEKTGKNYQIEGYEDGCAPKEAIEAAHGPYVFLEAGINEILPEMLERAIDASGLEIVSQPKIDIEPVELKEGLVFTVEVYTKPEIILGEYKGIRISDDEFDCSVTDTELEKAMDVLRKRNARMVPVQRPVMLGDQAVLDFEGFVDGVAFEGGKGENYPLVVGSGSFIPGFEEQVLGKRIEVPFDVHVTFPENYHADNLKGKASVFKCVVHEVREKQLPDLDDEFIRNVTEFDTLAEYQDSVRAKLQEQRAQQAETAKEDMIIQKLVDNATVVDMPECMIEEEVDAMLDTVSYQLQQSGMGLDDYFKMLNTTEEVFRLQLKPDAMMRIKARLVLEKIAEHELIVVTESEVNAQIQAMVQEYHLPDDSMFDANARKMLHADLVRKKTVDFLMGR